MNKDQAKGKWNRAKGKAKLSWGMLTSNNSKKVEGSADMARGAIQEKVGDVKKAIKKGIRSW